MPTDPQIQWEIFDPLLSRDFIIHGFSCRSPQLDTRSDRALDQFLDCLGFDPREAATAEQTHGNGVAVVDEPPAGPLPGVDALITDTPGLALVIRSADCVPVFLVDPARPAIGLVHSGKAGTRLNVVGHTLASMQRCFGTDPAACHATLGPSIGPCHYEVDLWDSIETQLTAAGLTDVFNPRRCTACHLDRYYSYRAEKGRTGRMLAVLALA